MTAWTPRHAQVTSRNVTLAQEGTHVQLLHGMVLSNTVQEGVTVAAVEAAVDALVQALHKATVENAAGSGLPNSAKEHWIKDVIAGGS